MSTKKTIQTLDPCFGEAFIDDFFFSSMFSTSMNYEDTVSVRHDKDYVHGEFLEEDLIKSKFGGVKKSIDGVTTPSMNTNQSSGRSKKTWGWSEVKYQAEELEPETPFAKKSKRILNMVDKAKNIGTEPIDGDDDDVYSFKVPGNQFSLLNQDEKFDKKRPPPTYGQFYEYEDMAKNSAHHPMSGLKIRENMNRVECVNEKIIEDNKGLKKYLVKELAKNIFKGSTNVSLPAYAFDPISNLSAFMNNFRTAPYFLDKAVHVSPKTDPVERIKLISAMGVSSLHQNISFKRAFNPIIGETYQGYFCFDNPEAISETPDHGFSKKPSRLQKIKTKKLRQTSQPTNAKSKFINIFAEQISHHPPISCFQIEHSDREYVIYGDMEEDFKRNGSNLEFRYKGQTIIEFSDGDYYSITWPAKILENSVFMKYEEFVRIEQLNETNLTSMIFLGDSQEGDPLPVNGVIYYRDPDEDFNPEATNQDDLGDMEEFYGTLQGSWVKALIIDDKKYWNIKMDVISPQLPVSNPLPSDGRYREDLVWIGKEDIDIAQKWKLALENTQRKDATLRKKKKKKK